MDIGHDNKNFRIHICNLSIKSKFHVDQIIVIL